ncbi:MAG: hypothetical protein KDB53_05120, partial [Planctomycetes bacterium]|nr:hypothetical protein [Planctomycetota bacterium]
IEAEFAAGSFVPASAQFLLDNAEWPENLACGGSDGHDALDIDPTDIDLVFVFPWPGEARVIESVFARICDPGAMLLMWERVEGARLLRKD